MGQLGRSGNKNDNVILIDSSIEHRNARGIVVSNQIIHSVTNEIDKNYMNYCFLIIKNELLF